MKLTDWRKGFAQAYRYSYFADLAIVVLPPDSAKAAEVELSLFRKLGVGLWSFEKNERANSQAIHTAPLEPRNARAKEKLSNHSAVTQVPPVAK